MGKINLIPFQGKMVCVTEAARALGIHPTTLANRLKKMPLEEALTSQTFQNFWKPEEDEYLCQVYKAPNLHELWSRVAKRNGWRRRSKTALYDRMTILRKQGYIGQRKDLEEADGWLTEPQLASRLGITRTIIRRWSTIGLIHERDGEEGAHRYHLKHFVNWATSPIGAAEIANATKGDILAVTWVLTQIGNWINEPNPAMSKPLGKPRKAA